jgi:hypothetical protein
MLEARRRSLAPAIVLALVTGLWHPGAWAEEGSRGVLAVSTGTFEVPPGESYQCFYTDTVTDRPLQVVAAYGHQQAKGHHLAVYYTMPPQEVAHFPVCKPEQMANWHLVVVVAGDDEDLDFLKLPPGVAVPVPAGAQIVLQSHYINTTGHPVPTEDRVKLHLAGPGEITASANLFVFSDEGFEIAPSAHGQSVTTCTVPIDLRVLRVAGHMHEFGTHYRLEWQPAGGGEMAVLYETDWEPMFTWNPPVHSYTLEAPLLVSAGTRLRQTCQWHNTTEQPLRHSREMCVGIMTALLEGGLLSCGDVQPAVLPEPP